MAGRVEFKQVMVIRKDLDLSLQDAARLACRATVGTYRESASPDARQWLSSGQMKIILGVPGLYELLELSRSAEGAGVPSRLVGSNGRAESSAVLGIGPSNTDLVDGLTGALELYRGRRRRDSQGVQSFQFGVGFEGDPVQLVFVRDDLGMTPGKAISQVCHASLGGYVQSSYASPGLAERWLSSGQDTRIGFAHGAEGLKEMARKAEHAGLPFTLVEDAGRTEIPSGTQTAVALGPIESKFISEALHSQ